MSIIQTSYGTPNAPGNFYAVHLEGNNLVLYIRDNSVHGGGNGGGTWKRGEVITSMATSAGSIIQSTYGLPSYGNFEVVVLEGKNLVHYSRDNSTDTWSNSTTVSTRATGAGSVIQSTYGTPTSHGNFEVVVLEGKSLVHYYRDNSVNGGHAWHRGVIVTPKASGPGSIIQSSYSTPYAPGDFEVVVPEGSNLMHYSRDNSANGSALWKQRQAVTSKATGSGSIIQNTYSTPNAPGNYDVVVLEGSEFVQYYRDNSKTGGDYWTRGTTVTSNATGPGAIIQSSYGTPYAPGNFEVIVVEDRNLVQYCRDNTHGQGGWSIVAAISHV